MTTKLTMQDREKSLEEEFFRKKEKETLAQLRDKKLRDESVAELSSISGIRDQTVLGHLVDAGIRAETLLAFGLVPLVAVAWADGEITDDEKTAVLAAASAAGLVEGTVAYQTLGRMLGEKPSSKMFSAWTAYAGELVRSLPAAERGRIVADTVARARAVAQASGGVLGLAKESSAERRVIAEIEKALAS